MADTEIIRRIEVLEKKVKRLEKKLQTHEHDDSTLSLEDDAEIWAEIEPSPG